MDIKILTMVKMCLKVKLHVKRALGLGWNYSGWNKQSYYFKEKYIIGLSQ